MDKYLILFGFCKKKNAFYQSYSSYRLQSMSKKDLPLSYSLSIIFRIFVNESKPVSRLTADTPVPVWWVIPFCRSDSRKEYRQGPIPSGHGALSNQRSGDSLLAQPEPDRRYRKSGGYHQGH